MENYLDRSNFFRGILVITTKDGKISEAERNYVLKVGKDLGFEKKFCQSAIDEVLNNKFIKLTPPEFSDKSLIEKFLIHGIELAYADSHFHPKEIDFLRETAIKNGYPEEWFNEKINEKVRATK